MESLWLTLSSKSCALLLLGFFTLSLFLNCNGLTCTISDKIGQKVATFSVGRVTVPALVGVLAGPMLSVSIASELFLQSTSWPLLLTKVLTRDVRCPPCDPFLFVWSRGQPLLHGNFTSWISSLPWNPVIGPQLCWALKQTAGSNNKFPTIAKGKNLLSSPPPP